MTKYPHRKASVEDWSFVDLMRMIHLRGDDLPLEGQYVLKYTVKGIEEASTFLDVHPEIKESPVVKYISAVEKVKALTDNEDERVVLIKTVYEFNLPREVLPTWAFNYPDVWRALLLNREQTKVTMPMTALVRNLGVMSSRGVFDDALTTSLVVEHLQNDVVIKKARLHPVNILIAMSTYRNGHGDKGKLTWVPHSKILAALEGAFYKSFKHVAPTGKRILHAIDCSGSMTSAIPVLPQLSAHEAATVMAMTFARIEAESPQKFVGFSAAAGRYSYGYGGGSALRELAITPDMTLDVARHATQFSDFGSTDCSLPIENALAEFKASGGAKGNWDVFMVYTDNETYAGTRHPSEALKEYRAVTGIPAKMVVIATDPSATSIVDPSDGGMMEVVGFDTNAPEIAMNFIRGDSLDTGLEGGAVAAEEE